MRTAFRALILQISSATQVIPPERWVQRSAIAVEVPARPFAVISVSGDNRGVRGASKGAPPIDFEIWVHDDPGSYARIDAVLTTLQDYFLGVTGFDWDGVHISCTEPQGVGPDLQDEVFRTVTRSLRVRVVGRSL